MTAHDSLGDALFLVDGSGFIFRAYHALPKFTTAAGQPTGAVYGFAQMLLKLEQDHHPARLAVVFDASSTSFRDALYADYKANRAETPEDLAPQFALVREVVRAFGVPAIEQEGYEADDLIATLTRRAVEEGRRVVIVSSDKDMMQLISDGDGDGVLMIRPVWQSGPRGKGGMEDVLYRAAEVEARYGVRPSQLGDVLALMGDSVDNVPGVPGIGEKTASALIRHFGSLEALLARLDEVPQVPKLRGAEKVRQTLAEHVEQARLSRTLVTLDAAVPIEADPATLARGVPDFDRVAALFRELEFHRLLERIQANSGEAKPVEAEAGAAEPPARLILDEAALAKLLMELRDAGELALACECIGEGPFALVCGLAFAADGVEPAYLPFEHRYLGAPEQLPAERAFALLRPLLADPAVKKHIHGSKAAYRALRGADIALAGVVGDPELGAYLLDPTRDDERQRDKPLAPLAARFGATARERDDLLGNGKNGGKTKKSSALGYESVEVERAAAYATGRARATLVASRGLRAELEARAMATLYDTIELPLARVLALLERHGIAVDTAALGTLGEEMTAKLEQLEAEVARLAGYSLNLGSPKQLQELLFERMALPAGRKTKTGHSTDAAVLEELAEAHPEAAPILLAILEHRAVAKLKGTYVDALPALVAPRTGRIHTTFHQTVAGTGRLSSSDPNLQNIPIRSELGRLVRRAFVAAPGHLLVSADYSQIELRVLAHLCEDPVLTDAFRHGEDIHQRTAREMFSVEAAAVTAEMRRIAKAINYGLIYGQTDFGLARAVGISREEARRYIASYFGRYARVAAYMEQLVVDARREGGTRTLFGRFRPLPELASGNRNLRLYGERMARNTPIQGTAADLLKLAMITLEDRLERELPRTRMLLTVHDELVLEAPRDEAEQAGHLVQEVMEHCHELRVPLVVEVGVGASWADC